MVCWVFSDTTNTNVTVDSDFKIKVVHLVNDANLCTIRGLEIKTGAEKIIIDAVRIGKELHQLNPTEEEMHYQIILLGDDGGNTTYSYIHKTDGNKFDQNVFFQVFLKWYIVSKTFQLGFTFPL